MLTANSQLPIKNAKLTAKDNLEIIGNDDTGVSIIYTDANGQPIQNQSLPSLATVTLSGVSNVLYICLTLIFFIDFFY